MPFTFFISSMLTKFPFSFLYSIILFAREGPIPGRFSSSDDVALFIFIVPCRTFRVQ